MNIHTLIKNSAALKVFATREGVAFSIPSTVARHTLINITESMEAGRYFLSTRCRMYVEIATAVTD